MAHPKAGKPNPGASVKLLAAVLAGRGFDLERRLFPMLEERFGRIDHRGAVHPFDGTDYYEDEMGPSLGRLVISFEPLCEATDIVQVKLDTAAMEEDLSEDGGRRVNIDPGYMDYYKIILASFKEGPQKIYLGRGVYADPDSPLLRGGIWAASMDFSRLQVGHIPGRLPGDPCPLQESAAGRKLEKRQITY